MKAKNGSGGKMKKILIAAFALCLIAPFPASAQREIARAYVKKDMMEKESVLHVTDKLARRFIGQVFGKRTQGSSSAAVKMSCAPVLP
jgi:hypothetical protein